MLWKLNNSLFGWHYASFEWLYCRKIGRVFFDQEGRAYVTHGAVAIYLDEKLYKHDGLKWEHSAVALTFPSSWMKDGHPKKRARFLVETCIKDKVSIEDLPEWAQVAERYDHYADRCLEVDLSAYLRSISADLKKLGEAGASESLIGWKTVQHALRIMETVLDTYEIESFADWPEEVRAPFKGNVLKISAALRGQHTTKNRKVTKNALAKLEALDVQLERLPKIVATPVSA